MRRSFAHLVAAGSTVVLLEGLSIGLAASLAWAGDGAADPPGSRWRHLAATAAWVIVLLAPVAGWLASRRRHVGWAAVAVGLVAAGVRLALDLGDGPASAWRWALVDGVGLALGLLVYDLIFGISRAARAG